MFKLKTRIKNNIFYFVSLIFILFLWSGSIYADKSFLNQKETPDSLKILPPPPAYNSVDFLRDQADYNEGKSKRDTILGKQAIKDADLSIGNIGRLFSQAFGMNISQKSTPEIYKLLNKLQVDSDDLATKNAKVYYMRERPFVFFNTHSCTPNDEESLKKNGSYPSGHTSVGWATALVLTEINPVRMNQILERGYQIGQSRVICGVHWQSDVDEGRIIGAATVARLHANKNFLHQLERAKNEFKKRQYIKHQ